MPGERQVVSRPASSASVALANHSSTKSELIFQIIFDQEINSLVLEIFQNLCLNPISSLGWKPTAGAV
jgi:hypothetical protein